MIGLEGLGKVDVLMYIGAVCPEIAQLEDRVEKLVCGNIK
jgi:hypothetical protein